MAPQFSKNMIETLVKESVLEFTVKAGSKPGDNVAGEISAIQVQTTSGKTFNLVIKTLPVGDGELKDYVVGFQVFALEISIYTNFKDSLERFIKSRDVSSEQFPVPFPPYFGGLCDGENDYLCLEDQRSKGFKMPDKYVGLNFQEVSLIIKDLAKFHALTYSFIKYEGEMLFECTEGMQRLISNFFAEKSPEVDFMILMMFGNGLEVAKKLLIKQNPILGEILKHGLDKSKVLPLMRYISGLTDSVMFPVIIHGDFWGNNILIKYDELGRPISTKFIDFQQTRRGNIFDDLIYFIFASTTPDFRAEHLPQMLNYYYNSFISSVKLLNVPAPANFTLGFFLDTFFSCYMSGFTYMMFAIPMQLGVDEEKEPKLNPNLDDRSEKMTRKLERMFESHPKALDRLESIVREFADMKLL